MSLTKFPNGVQSYVVNKNATVVTGNISVVAGDSGKEYLVTANSIVSLPAIGAGHTYKFILAEDGLTFAVSPTGSNAIAYAGSGTLDKDLQLASSVKGDYVVICSFQGASTWQVTSCRGTWTKEA